MRGTKVVEGHEEPDAVVVSGEILEQEETHIAAEVSEQSEKVGVAQERGTEWVVLAQVVAANALEREVHSVSDARVEPSSR